MHDENPFKNNTLFLQLGTDSEETFLTGTQENGCTSKPLSARDENALA